MTKPRSDSEGLPPSPKAASNYRALSASPVRHVDEHLIKVHSGAVSYNMRQVSDEMPGKAKQVYFLALLLVAVVVAAQLHCCVELNSNTLDSHVCPICSSAGAAIAPSA